MGRRQPSFVACILQLGADRVGPPGFAVRHSPRQARRALLRHRAADCGSKPVQYGCER